MSTYNNKLSKSPYVLLTTETDFLLIIQLMPDVLPVLQMQIYFTKTYAMLSSNAKANL